MHQGIGFLVGLILLTILAGSTLLGRVNHPAMLHVSFGTQRVRVRD